MTVPARADRFGPVTGQDLESAVGGHRPGGEAADERAVPGNADQVGPLVAEDVAGHPQLEHGDPVADDDGDVVIGRIVAHNDNADTFLGPCRGRRSGHDYRSADSTGLPRPPVLGSLAGPGVRPVSGQPARGRVAARNQPAAWPPALRRSPRQPDARNLSGGGDTSCAGLASQRSRAPPAHRCAVTGSPPPKATCGRCSPSWPARCRSAPAARRWPASCWATAPGRCTTLTPPVNWPLAARDATREMKASFSRL